MSDKATLREPLIADEENSQRQQRMSGVSRTHSRSDEANFYGYYNGFDETLYYKSQEDSLESKRNRDGPFYCCCCFSCKYSHIHTYTYPLSSFIIHVSFPLFYSRFPDPFNSGRVHRHGDAVRGARRRHV